LWICFFFLDLLMLKLSYKGRIWTHGHINEWI